MRAQCGSWWIYTLLFALCAMPSFASTNNYPSWWMTRNVITNVASTNDYAAANMGQLKWFATNAYAELEANLPGGAGTSISNLILGFSATNNYPVINLGQLKYAASLFYDRLIEAGYTNAYPWTANTADDANYAAANVGQLKNLFFFNITPDSDSDGLPNWWEAEHGLNTTNSSDATADSDGDGFMNVYEYRHSTDPNDVESSPTATRYVSLTGSHTSPYTNWTMAATNIQAALNVASNYDIIYVAAGTYSGAGNTNIDFGGRDVMLTGTGLAANCIVNGGGVARGFYLHSGESCHAIIRNLTVTNGYSSGDGGGILCEYPARVTIQGCRVAGNAAANCGGGISIGYIEDYPLPVIESTEIVGNIAADGGGVGCDYMWAAAVLLTNCVIRNNSVSNEYGAYGGGILAQYAEIYCCIINSNSAAGGTGEGGGIYTLNGIYYNNIVSSNHAGATGGGASIAGGTGKNCLFFSNSAVDGGGLCLSDGSFINSTFTGNAATNAAGGFKRLGGSLANCIVYGNTCINSNVLANYNTNSPSFVYSCTTPLPPGSGNMTNNPLFVDAAARNYRLTNSSPCIDAGSNDYLSSLPDLDGNERPNGLVTDMGAYECIRICRYVSLAGSHTSPFTSWSTAATNIQAALDVSTSNDIVYVADGTYTGTGNRDLDFKGKSVMLASTNRAETCIIDCERQGRGFLFHSGEGHLSVINGLTIRNGKGGNGGGVSCVSNSCPTLRNCIVEDSIAALEGGGIYCLAASPRLENSVLRRNWAYYMGGAFYSASGTAAVWNCTVVDNMSGQDYGGIFASVSSTVTVHNSIIWDNTEQQISGNGTNMVAPRFSIIEGYSGGYANKTNNPAFAGSSYRLLTNSPAIDSGTNYVPAFSDIQNENRWDYPGCTNVVSAWDIGVDEFVDSDSDGMDDGWENRFFGNLSHNGTADGDGDSLVDLAEYEHAADPADSDTDNDGLNDGVEVNTYGTDPADADTDNDQLNDDAETSTSPLDPDSDNDGVSDGSEVLNGYSPFVSNYYYSLSFTDDFETVSAGGLDGQHGWDASPTGSVIVQTSVVHGGSKSVAIAASSGTTLVSHVFAAMGTTRIWENYYIRPALWPEGSTPEIPASSAVGYYVNSTGSLVVYNGCLSTNNWVTLTNHAVLATDTWVRITVKQDFNAREWTIYLNNTNLTSGLGFANNVTEYSAFWLKGPTNGTVYLDDFHVENDSDGDGDGLPDWWEIEYFGSTNGAGYGDSDNDGICDMDELQMGTDPTQNDTGATSGSSGDIEWQRIFPAISRHTPDENTPGYLCVTSVTVSCTGNWDRFYISSSPTGAGGWELTGLRIEEQKSGDTWHAVSSFQEVIAANNSLDVTGNYYIPDGENQLVSFRLFRNGANEIMVDKSLYLLRWRAKVDVGF